MKTEDDSNSRNPLMIALIGALVASVLTIIMLLAPVVPTPEPQSQGDTEQAENDPEVQESTEPGTAAEPVLSAETELRAIVATTSDIVVAGDSFRADIFLIPFEPTADVTIEFSDSSLNDFVTLDNGVAQLRIPVQKIGSVNITGIMSHLGQTAYFNTWYSTVRPCLFVNPTKQNVFYKGVENPISIQVPGYPLDKLRVSISNGSIRKVRSGYNVRVTSGKETTISVSTRDSEGLQSAVGKVQFRVKSVPNPTPFLAGKGYSDDNIRKKELQAAQGLTARVENFDFEMKFTVVSFSVKIIENNGNVTNMKGHGNLLTGKMKTEFGKISLGDQVIISGIKAKGPDDIVRKLGALTLKVI
jgi:gliding motility-associated protein GldM